MASIVSLRIILLTSLSVTAFVTPNLSRMTALVTIELYCPPTRLSIKRMTQRYECGMQTEVLSVHLFYICILPVKQLVRR